jgi:predicted nucleic acid-binding protein
MKKLKVYLDTSVIGGSFDDEFKEHSVKLITDIRNDKIIGMISSITIDELEKAPEIVKEDFERYKEKLMIIMLSDEIKELAKNYLVDKIISEKFYEDALHIACATVYQADVLVSWNFKHIVNFNRIIRFNAVNLKYAYKPIQIYSPMEMVDDEE